MQKNDSSKHIRTVVLLLDLLFFLIRVFLSYAANYELLTSDDEDFRINGIILFTSEIVSIAIPALIILVLCEILKNAYKSKLILTEISEMNDYNAFKDSIKFTPYWVCSCGTVNRINDSYCKKCNRTYNSTNSHISNATSSPKFATWLCPACEETNPNSERVCKSCGFQR